MSAREELGQNAAEQFDLARSTNELVVNEARRVHVVLDAVEQEGVLADLAQLHELVAQALDTADFAVDVFAIALKTNKENRHVPVLLHRPVRNHFVLLHLLVHLALQRTHADLDHFLDLVR